jgi:hypothetical protein
MERNSWGFSLFCDDIRAELGGKLSIMGLYQVDMVFPPSPDFPFAIPKFCILVKYYEVKNAFKDDITLRVFLPGDHKDAPSLAIPIQRAPLEAGAPSPYALEEDQEQLFNLTFPIVLSPFTLKQAGFLRVRAICGGITTNLGSLMIRTARSDENIQIPSFPTPQPPPG